MSARHGNGQTGQPGSLGYIHQRRTDHRRQACAHKGQSQPAYHLIGAQRDRNKGVEQGQRTADAGRGEQSQPWVACGMGHPVGGHGSQDHHAFDTQIEHTGALGKDLANRGEENTRARADARGQEIYDEG